MIFLKKFALVLDGKPIVCKINIKMSLFLSTYDYQIVPRVNFCI